MKKKDYILRNDLAIKNSNLKCVSSKKMNNFEIKHFLEDKYNYTDILFKNIENRNHKNKLINIFIKELKEYLKKYNLNYNLSVLIVGLGNKNIASDSLGIKTVNNIVATGYYDYLNVKEDYSKIYTYIPGVMRLTGISPYLGVKALKKELKPNLIIVIDSLICDEIKYLNSVIQITDAGIKPGGGLSNSQEEISINNLGIPVVTIGVPTAIETSTIIRDVLGIKENKFKFNEGYDFIFSTGDIDLVIDNLSKIIGEGINKSLNNFNIF